MAMKVFCLTSMLGLVGVYDANEGENVVPAAPDGELNSVWKLVEAKENIGTGIADYGYEQNVDYAVRYDKARQVIGFVSYDMQEFADIDVRIYTVGGRLLYTFKAINEQSLADIPSGTYLVEWSWAGRKHCVKLRKE